MPTLNISVIAGADDGHSSDDGTINELSPEVIVGTVGAVHFDGFFRFVNVAIPPGATINVAYLTYTDAGGADPATFTSFIYLNAADNATAPTTRASHVGKARTAELVGYDNLVGHVEGETYNTTDFAAVVQEVIDRPGWVSGNALMVLWDCDPGVGYSELVAFEHILFDPPILHIEYSESIIPQALDSDGVRKPPRPRARS